MRFFKLMTAVLLSAVLVGCGGHDYEGTWTSEAGAMGFSMQSGEIELGSDYMISDGVRSDANFEVIDQNGTQYLVVSEPSNPNDKIAFKIVSDDELIMDLGLAAITLRRQ